MKTHPKGTRQNVSVSSREGDPELKKREHRIGEIDCLPKSAT